MTGRYLAVVGGRVALQAGAAGDCEALHACATTIVDQPDLLVLATGDLAAQGVPGDRGAVLGSAFPLGSAAALDARLHHAAPGLDSARSFGERYWGGYIAILRDIVRGGFGVTRGTFGNVPCYYARSGGAVLLASDLDMLSKAGWVAGPINWERLRDYIVFRDLPVPATCIDNVTELRGGTLLSSAEGKPTIEDIWSPWDHAGRSHWHAGRGEAERAVHDAVMLATRASMQRASRPLLMLSGGLDSSVLAASIAAQGRDFVGFNLSSGGFGDERRYAALVAERTGARLVEAAWDVALVDVTASAAARLPNPAARNFMQGTNCLLDKAIAQTGSDLVVDGGGGDNVFCSLQSVGPVLDALLQGRSMRQTASTALSIAQLAEVSVSKVAQGAIRRLRRRSAAYRWHRADGFFRPEVVEGLSQPWHPWLERPSDIGIGSAAHVGLIVAAQGWAESNDIGGRVPRVSPLASRPVAEACLQVPSWWWFMDGRNRAIARAAFRERLPAEIVDRRSKGSPDTHVAELLEANRPVIRAMLLDGRLRANGLLDASALSGALDDPAGVRSGDITQIMRLVDVEAWLASRT